MIEHLKRVPFQNLGYYHHGSGWINFNQPETLVESAITGEGGICFHLNYSFSRLLQWLGFDCYVIGCFMSRTDTDHMAIVVKLDDVPYLVDVGYGESLLRQPLPIMDGANQRVLATTIRLQLVDGRWVLQQGKQTVYRFQLHPRLFQEFEPTYRYQLESVRNFCKHIFFSRANENGFVRLVDDRLTLFLEGQVITTKINLEGFKWK